jgi:hypothetical protein
MAFTPGQEVEVKLGGSLGRWLPGNVIRFDAGCCGKLGEYAVAVEGRTVTVEGNRVRRPRNRSDSGLRTKAPPKAKAERSARGPLRYPKFKAWVKAKPCIFCHRKADDPHHYGRKGTGQTTDDTKIVPVCRQGHDALHHRRLDELCAPAEYLGMYDDHRWARVEALIFRTQVELVTEYLRFHGGRMA